MKAAGALGDPLPVIFIISQHTPFPQDLSIPPCFI